MKNKIVYLLLICTVILVGSFVYILIRTDNFSVNTKNNAVKTKNNAEKTKNNAEKTMNNAEKTMNNAEKTMNNAEKTMNDAEKTMNDVIKDQFLVDQNNIVKRNIVSKDDVSKFTKHINYSDKEYLLISYSYLKVLLAKLFPEIKNVNENNQILEQAPARVCQLNEDDQKLLISFIWKYSKDKVLYSFFQNDYYNVEEAIIQNQKEIHKNQEKVEKLQKEVEELQQELKKPTKDLEEPTKDLEEPTKEHKEFQKNFGSNFLPGQMYVLQTNIDKLKLTISNLQEEINSYSKFEIFLERNNKALILKNKLIRKNMEIFNRNIEVLKNLANQVQLLKLNDFIKTTCAIYDCLFPNKFDDDKDLTYYKEYFSSNEEGLPTANSLRKLKNKFTNENDKTKVEFINEHLKMQKTPVKVCTRIVCTILETFGANDNNIDSNILNPEVLFKIISWMYENNRGDELKDTNIFKKLIENRIVKDYMLKTRQVWIKQLILFIKGTIIQKRKFSMYPFDLGILLFKHEYTLTELKEITESFLCNINQDEEPHSKVIDSNSVFHTYICIFYENVFSCLKIALPTPYDYTLQPSNIASNGEISFTFNDMIELLKTMTSHFYLPELRHNKCFNAFEVINKKCNEYKMVYDNLDLIGLNQNLFFLFMNANLSRFYKPKHIDGSNTANLTN